jgi:glycosyltransferase involved in cell wall biosynthesis
MNQGPTPSGYAPVLSIVIPVYNEMHTIGQILLEVTRALREVHKQIIVVDDCSGDGTAGWLRRNLADAEGVWRGMSLDRDGELDLSAIGPQNEGGFSFTVLFHERNSLQNELGIVGLSRRIGAFRFGLSLDTWCKKGALAIEFRCGDTNEVENGANRSGCQK